MNAKPHPELSVIMSVYNNERYISRAIDSILAQSFEDFEVIIVDDASTDNTLDILTSYAQKDSRIKIIKNEKNIGLTQSLNKALQYAHGEFIARMDADDISADERFKLQIEFMKNNHNIGLLGTARFVIDEDDNILDVNIPPTQHNDICKALIKHNVFCHSSMMFRKAVFDKVGYYDERWESAQDYELAFRIARYFELANLDKPLIYWRVNKTSGISFVKSRKQIKNAIKARIKAITDGQYPGYCYIYVIYPYISMLISPKIKEIIKKYILHRKY
jgi:glycosyltransferase involved in cell wall biosynthesis